MGKERPILFSAPMVRAILNDRKYQTRRIVKPQPPASCRYEINGNHNKAICLADDSVDVPERPWFVPPYVDKAQCYVECPYGQPGDRLWVRETWAPMSTFDPSPETGAVYKADDHPSQKVIPAKWKPSIHMPRWASRITLEVTGVTVERLRDISEADAFAEGIETSSNGVYFMDYTHGIANACKPEFSFMTLWESINGKGSWDVNPWVWVVSFERVTT